MSVDAAAWTTVANCKLQLGISDSTQDAFIESLVNRSYKILETYLGRQIKSQTLTEYYDGPKDNAQDSLLLNVFPIISITSIYDDLDRIWADSSLLDPANYVVYKERGIVKLYRNEGFFQQGIQNIKVVYTAGYATIPGDIEDAGIQMVEHMFNRARTAGFQSQSLGGKSETYDNDEIPAAVKRVLRNYRVYVRSENSST
jgi:uncharacterized phiE125 gp8 family phage protein